MVVRSRRQNINSRHLPVPFLLRALNADEWPFIIRDPVVLNCVCATTDALLCDRWSSHHPAIEDTFSVDLVG